MTRRAVLANAARLGALGLFAAGCSSAPENPSTAATTTAHHPKPAPALTFPRTATYFLEQYDLPSVAEFAQYDLVVIDHEWSHRAGPGFFDDLRAQNPRVRILAYVNVVDRLNEIGPRDYWQQKYALWKFDGETVNSFPLEWAARTAAGDVVSEWPKTTMTNLTDLSPRVDGQQFLEFAADWVDAEVWSTGVWDGIFLDVWGDRIFTADFDDWDIDGNGVDEAKDDIYGFDKPWERGVTRAEQIMRSKMPDAILIANGDRTLRPGLLNGRVWEDFADPEFGRDPQYDIDRYVEVTSSAPHRTPGTAMTINHLGDDPESDETLRKARYFLAATLLQNGFWAPMGSTYGQLRYFDEMGGDESGGTGLERGYLGAATESNPTLDRLRAPFTRGAGTVGDGVLRRDFEHGIVLVNTASAERDVPLEQEFFRFAGTQDRVVNDGSSVTSVRLAPQDGLILLRQPRQ